LSQFIPNVSIYTGYFYLFIKILNIKIIYIYII
jgi:hypothetical protein